MQIASGMRLLKNNEAGVRSGVLQSDITFFKEVFTHDALTQRVREILHAVA